LRELKKKLMIMVIFRYRENYVFKILYLECGGSFTMYAIFDNFVHRLTPFITIINTVSLVYIAVLLKKLVNKK
ncbi:hypothetical protein, partial [Peribacillus butanolivorans]|uniref:hypothetical protein n=1 Tax=Peribacillus butanolivorans TaxID=421767 RepID=UPI001C3ED800